MQSSTETGKTTDQATKDKVPPVSDGTAKKVNGESSETRQSRAAGIVRRNVYWALGVGIIPVAIVDVLGILGVELKMIKEISDAYGVTFKENVAKSIVSSLALSVGSVGIAGFVGGSLMKLIPAVGQIVGVLGVSVVAAAFTQALGNVFIMHFESGGTLLTFKPEQMRDYFRKEFEKAKATVSQLRTDGAERESAAKSA